MSTTKLSFRARALDAAKPMAVFMAHELPDLPDFTIINRAVPQMPTGMEKEEETEHHLQRAIVTGLIIPTPEVFQVDEVGGCYNRCYPGEWKVPRNLIHMQPFTMEQDIPDYDMDSDDEKWINSQAEKLEISPLQFEEMMDRLEKSSGQTVITLNEAKSLLKQDDDLIVAVYDYWLNKRLKMLNPLIPQVKTEKFGGTGSSGNPYIAFRRRTEKMQTRKHRKNDEASYEKMLKLRRDLSRALTVLDMVKKRENCKRDIVVCGIEVYEKRYALSDYSGHIINEVNAQVKQQPRPSYTPLSTIQSSNVWSNSIPQMTGTLQTNRGRAFKDDLRKERRNYHRRRIKSTSTRGGLVSPGLSTLPAGNPAVSSRGFNFMSDAQSASSEEEIEGTMGASQSDVDDMESELDKQGPFGFRRKLHCNYLAPTQVSSSNSCYDPDDSGLVDARHRYFLASLTSPKSHCLGYVRRRFGRGGRVVLDRSYSQRDGKLSYLNDLSNCQVLNDELKEEIMQLRHFKPITEAQNTDVESHESSSNLSEGSDVPGSVIICPDGDEEHGQTYDPHSVMDNVFLDGGLDGLRMPSSKCFSPPSVTNSCVSVIGDTSPSLEKFDSEWWNYFEPVSEVENVTQEINSHEHGKKSQLNPHLNGINSSPAVNDSPSPWKVSKSASLPSNDCSMVNPCLGELHTSEENDQNNQTVVDFLLIDSTFAMEVT